MSNLSENEDAYGPHICPICEEPGRVGETMVAYMGIAYHEDCFNDFVYEITGAELFKEPAKEE